MSPPGGSEGECRSAQHEETPVNAAVVDARLARLLGGERLAALRARLRRRFESITPGAEATVLRIGGLIAIDNVLWNGSVARPASDADTTALQALNDKLHRDERIDLALLPIGDGLTLARKR